MPESTSAAAQRLGDGDASGFAALYCQHHGGRDPLELKVEQIVPLVDAAAVARLEAQAAAAQGFFTSSQSRPARVGKRQVTGPVRINGRPGSPGLMP